MTFCGVDFYCFDEQLFAFYRRDPFIADWQAFALGFYHFV